MFCAKGEGFIHFGIRLNERAVREVTSILEEELRMNWMDFSNTQSNPSNENGTMVEFDVDDKYSGDDEVKEALEGIRRIALVESGEIEYIGEDDTYWRFIYKDNEWKMQRGTVVYEDI